MFWALAGVFAIGSSAQVASQLFWPVEIPAPGTCDEGLRVLATSLDEGWEAARRADDGAEPALARFRQVVGPPWRALPGVERKCATDGPRAARLDALTRLRYALEAKVRVEGGSLAALRRRATDPAATRSPDSVPQTGQESTSFPQPGPGEPHSETTRDR